MHADRASGGWAGAGAGLAIVFALVLVPARARAIGGHIIVQFQDIQQKLAFRDAAGNLRTSDVSRQFWSQIYDLEQSSNLRPNLNVFWQFQLNDLAYRGLTLNERTPYGALRITHPVAGATASYRPITTTTGVRDANGVEVTSTLRRRESLVTAYLAPPRLPRLDVTWQRLNRERDQSIAAQIGTTRQANLTWDGGPFSVHAGYGDIDQSGGSAGPGTLQRNVDGGAAFRAGDGAHRAGTLAYEYSESQYERGRLERTQIHTATATGLLRPSPHSDWTFYYNLRRSMLDNSVHTDLLDHESSLFYGLQATRAVRLLAGGGAHTIRTATEEGLGRYVSAVLTANGPLHSGWTGNADLSSVTTWEPDRAVYSVQSVHGVTRFRLQRALTLDADLLTTANGDTAARAGRVVVQTSVGLEAIPLRILTLTLSTHRYQAGPGLFVGTSESRTVNFGIRLKPVRTFDATADFTNVGSLPYNAPQLRTTQVNANWNPRPTLRLTGYLTRSDRTQANANAAQLRGREIVGARLLAALSRSLILNSGVNVADPGTNTRSRQADASLTWNFGGPS